MRTLCFLRETVSSPTLKKVGFPTIEFLSYPPEGPTQLW